jgi:hypothetical protein
MSLVRHTVGQTPRSAADGPIGLFALLRLRDEGVPRRPGGLPSNSRAGGVAQ